MTFSQAWDAVGSQLRGLVVSFNQLKGRFAGTEVGGGESAGGGGESLVDIIRKRIESLGPKKQEEARNLLSGINVDKIDRLEKDLKISPTFKGS